MEAKELRIGNLIQFKSTGNIEMVEDIITYKRKYGCINDVNIQDVKPIPLTEEWLLKFGFENWGKGNLYTNEYETYDRFVLHNVLDGTSNFEVHIIKSTYGGSDVTQYIISCDEDDRLNWGEELEYVHQLQNLYFALTNNELTIQ